MSDLSVNWKWVRLCNLRQTWVTDPVGNEYELRDGDLAHPRAERLFTAMLDALQRDEKEIVYRCRSCGHIHMEPVTQCDCMPAVQEFDTGYVTVHNSDVVECDLSNAAKIINDLLESDRKQIPDGVLIEARRFINRVENLKGMT